jgi:L-threonylcarbamoyladenylate synthase
MVSGLQQFKSLNNSDLIKLLSDGAVGVLPTDTVYGLVAAAGNEQAVSELYGLKSREKNPGTLIAANINQLVELGIPRRYLKAVEQYWPGPVSVIVPTEMNLGYLHLGKFSLACRVPDDEKISQLLEKTGPLITTSANHPGETTATVLKQAEKYFDDQVDFYVDGGDLSKREASTIIRIVDDAVEVVRQGAVKIDEASGLVID